MMIPPATPLLRPDVLRAGTRTDELWDAWAFAAVEAQLALKTWIDAPMDGKGDAFFSYRAALDREEQAATVLAAHTAG
jgi:hypothetical protein